MKGSALEDGTAYTQRDLKRAVNISAILGWLAFVTPYVLHNPFALPWVAVFGLPIAFSGCWLIGAPILRRVMKRPIGWLRAATWGGAIAAIMAFISVAIGRFLGWKMSQNPSSNSRIGGDGSVQSIDGILTPYGWWVLAQNTALFIAIGVMVGLIVRRIIGPGTES